MKKGWKLSCLFGLCLLLVGIGPAWSEDQDLTPREKELMEVIQRLEKRVSDLEEKVSAGPAPAPAEAVLSASEKQEMQERLDKVGEWMAKEKKEGPSNFRVYWKDGVRFDTADGAYKFKIGGRIHNDWYMGDIENGDFPDGVKFRRARIALEGLLNENIEFKTQYDVAGDGTGKWRDVYAGYLGWDYAKFRIGHQYEPFGLETQTSSNYITFIERSPLVGLTPDRQTGLQIYNEILNNRLRWAAGGFKVTNAFGDADDADSTKGDWDATFRLTGLPWYEEDGRKLLHLGAAYSYREWSDDGLRYRSRGSFSVGNYLADVAGSAKDSKGGSVTLDLPTDNINLFGLEAALVYGPFSLQSEYVLADVNGSDNFEDSTYQSAYVDASYFLTGEHRVYKEGVFSRIKPKRNFMGKDGGPGAWQIAARYTWLDLDDTPIDSDYTPAAGLTSYVPAPGGVIHDLTAGINWHLNANARIMWNYVHSFLESNESDLGDADALIMRLQVDF